MLRAALPPALGSQGGSIRNPDKDVCDSWRRICSSWFWVKRDSRHVLKTAIKYNRINRMLYFSHATKETRGLVVPLAADYNELRVFLGAPPFAPL